MSDILVVVLPFIVGSVARLSCAAGASLLVAKTVGIRKPALALNLALALYGAALAFSVLPPLPMFHSSPIQGLSVSVPVAGLSASNGESAVAAMQGDNGMTDAEPDGSPAFPSVLCLVWLAGCLSLVGWRLASGVRIGALLSGSETPADPDFLGKAGIEAARMGFPSAPKLMVVRTASSPLGTSPFVARSIRQVVVFPESALRWPESRLTCAFLHEFAHVRRHDNLRLGILRAATFLAWLSPLPWLALAACERLQERACDEEVLSKGEKASVYAAELLAAARLGAGSGKPIGFAAMAARKGIDMRIRSILDRDGAAKSPSRLQRSLAALAMAVALFSFAIVGDVYAEPGAAATGAASSRAGSDAAIDMALPLDDGWQLTMSYGNHPNPMDGTDYRHVEIDLGMRLGSAVKAAADGILVDSGMDEGLGYYAVLEHDLGVRTRYTHLSRAVSMPRGARLERGQAFGPVGSSGMSTGPHLGFAVLVASGGDSWQYTDPMPYLAKYSPVLVLSAIGQATLSNRLDELSALLALKPDLNMSLPDGSLPLESVLVMGNCEAARLLVAAGADPGRRTKSGKTILELARESGNKTLVSILSH